MNLRVEPLTEENRSDWDRFCEGSARCWFWHTSGWQHYTGLYEAEPAEAFMIRDDHGRVLGIAPRSAGPPAIADDLTRSRRAEVLERMLERLCGRSFRASPLHAIDDLLFVRREVTVGVAFDQVIDVASADRLWGGIRKGHRSDIRRAEEELTVEVVAGDGASITAFQELHLRAAGRVTRPQGTWDLMGSWLRAGPGRLWLAKERSGRAVGGAYVYLYKDGAFYGSAANDPELERILAIGHLLQWSILSWLGQEGSPFRRYDVGDQPAPAAASEKELAIASFKRGFGGTTTLVPTFRIREGMAP